uniref:Uncharacterized protein n=1 Tax=Solanum tuberosum TaxID=4113 RepID=M1DIW2_SOLTU
MSLYNLNSRAQEKASSSIHLEDIPESDPLYAKLQEFLTQKQGDTFASIAKEEVDDIKTYEKVEKREISFLLENSDIQRKEEPWKVFQRYLVNGLYFPEDDHQFYERFENMKPPQLQGGKNEEAHEFLTLFHEMLEAVDMGDA